MKHKKIKKKGSSKNWLGGSINISGSVKIDEGAVKALKNGASLLPSGIKKNNRKILKRRYYRNFK